jgi:hypothetical protein
MKSKLLAALVYMLWSGAALAQSAPSNPSMYYGQVPTVGQWIGWFEQKQDALTALTTAGGTLIGKLNLAPSTATNAGVNLGVGVAPSSPINGDMWITSSGLLAEINGSTVTFGSGSVSSVSNSNGTLTISPTTGAVVASLNLAHANTWTAAQTFNANDLVLGGVTGSTQCLQANTSGVVTGTSSACGAVTSTSNSDGTLTISPTTGAVVASLALSHANTWTGAQTFSTITTLPAGTTSTPPLLFGLGSAPTSPANGDVWFTSTGLFYRAGGTTVGPLISGLTDGTTTYSGGTAFGVNYDNSGVITTTSAGTLGQTLTSNGSAAAPTYKTGGQTLLNTLTASSSASLSDTTSLTSSYSEYDVILEQLVPASSTVTCEIEIQSGGSFQTTSYLSQTVYGNTTTASALGSVTTYIPCSAASAVTTATLGLSGTFHVSSPSGTSAAKMWRGTWGTGTYTGESSGYWNGGSGAVTGIEVLFSSGNIASGTVKIYGYN